jgi:hypothetical protein
MGVEKIGILGDDDGIFIICDACDLLIGCPVAGAEVEGMAGGLTQFAQADGQQTGKLGIDQEVHAAGNGSKRLILARRAA